MKTILHSLLAISSLAVAAASAQAQIKNPGFEFLTADWTQSGDLANFTAPSAIVGLLVDDVIAGRYRPSWAVPADYQ